MTKKYSNEYCFLSIFYFSTPELGVLASKQGQLAYFTWVSQGFNLSRETKALTPAHVPPHFVKFAGASFPLKFSSTTTQHTRHCNVSHMNLVIKTTHRNNTMKKICMTLAAVCYALSVCAQDNNVSLPAHYLKATCFFVWLRATTTSPM